MSIWIIAKPRLRFTDSIDTFISKLFDLNDKKIFILKPTYVYDKNSDNHDSLFSALMSNDVSEHLRLCNDFADILSSQPGKNIFIPIATNRLLTPILPKSISIDSSMRRRVRNRLDTIFGNMSHVFEEKPNCLIMCPDVDDFVNSMRLSLMLEDGYTTTRSEQIISEIIAQMTFGEYKIRQSGAFDVIKKITVPTGSSFAFMYSALLQQTSALQPIVTKSWLKPRSMSDFYLIEALSSRKAQNEILSRRPTDGSYATVSFRQIVEVLSYTSSEITRKQFDDISPDEEFIDLSDISQQAALEIDEINRYRYLWKSAEAIS